VFPDAVVTPALAVVTTDSRHYEAISENTFRFIPTKMGRKDLPRLHGINERIGTENYLELIRFFIQQIRNSAS
jgi:carboxypeptidase PM20D1